MRKNESIAINVFNYFDYYEYLEDMFEHLKSIRTSFSYRIFSRDAGIPNHNYLLRIIKRQRNLTLRYVPNVSTYLKHTKQEAEYFKTLVQFNNLKKPNQKEKLLRSLLSLRYNRGVHVIEDKKLKFFDKWYYPVVRELAVILDFKDDFNLLARNCVPRITAVQAEGAIKYLLENGFVEKTSAGRYAIRDQAISTTPEVDSAIIPKYHKKTISQCADAVETIKKEERSFSSLTLRVSKDTYEDMKKEIAGFRRRLLVMAKESKDPEMVCFAGFQLMPRSEKVKRTKK